jgi:hypothetical protein
MSIRFECECGKKLKATDDKIGKRVLCPDCGQPVTVPKESRQKVEAIDVASDGGRTLQDSAQTARELLKLSTAASREEQEAVNPSDKTVRKRGEEATLTLGEYLRYNTMQVGLPILGIVGGFFLVVTLAFWMYGEKRKYPELHPVSGTVTFDGQPLQNAFVTFRSQDAIMSDEKISASVGRTDATGRFRLQYVEGVRGAVKGKHFVEINKTGEDGIEMMPAKYHQKTELEAEVTPGKADGYDFVLQSE